MKPKTFKVSEAILLFGPEFERISLVFSGRRNVAPWDPRRSVGGPPPDLVGSDYLGLFVEEDGPDGPTLSGGTLAR